MSADEWWASSDVSTASLADYEILSRPSDDDDDLGESAMVPIDTDTGSILSSLSGDSSSSEDGEEGHNSILEHTLEDVQQVQALFDSQYHIASTHGLHPSGTPPLPVRNLLANSDSLSSWTGMITSWWTKPKPAKASEVEEVETESVCLDIQAFLKKYESTPITYMSSHERGYHSYLRVSPLEESVVTPEAIVKKKAVNLIAFGDVTKSDNSLFVSLAKPLLQLDQDILVWCYTFDESTSDTSFAGVVSETSGEFHSTRPRNVTSQTWNAHQHLSRDLSTVGFIYYGANTSVLPLEKYYLYLKSTNTPAFSITNRPISPAMNPHLLSSISGPINVHRSGKNLNNDSASKGYFPITRKQVMNMAGSHLMPAYLNLFVLSTDENLELCPTALEFFNLNETRSSQITVKDYEVEDSVISEPISLKNSSDFAFTLPFGYQHLLLILFSLCLLPLYIWNQDLVKSVNIWSPDASSCSHLMISTSVSGRSAPFHTAEDNAIWSTSIRMSPEDADAVQQGTQKDVSNVISSRPINAVSDWVHSRRVTYSYVEPIRNFFASVFHFLYYELVLSPIEAICSLYAESDLLKLQADPASDVKRLEGAEHFLKKTSSERSSGVLTKGTPTEIRSSIPIQSTLSLVSEFGGAGGLKTANEVSGLLKSGELSVTSHASGGEESTVKLRYFAEKKLDQVESERQSSSTSASSFADSAWKSSNSKFMSLFQRATSKADKAWRGTKHALSGHMAEAKYSEKAHKLEQLGHDVLDKTKEYGRSARSEGAKYLEFFHKNIAEQENYGRKQISRAADAGAQVVHTAREKLGNVYSVAADRSNKAYSIPYSSVKGKSVELCSAVLKEVPQLWSWVKTKGQYVFSTGLEEAPGLWGKLKSKANTFYSSIKGDLPNLIIGNQWFSAVSTQAANLANSGPSARSWRPTEKASSMCNSIKQRITSVGETSAYKGTKGRLWSGLKGISTGAEDKASTSSLQGKLKKTLGARSKDSESADSSFSMKNLLTTIKEKTSFQTKPKKSADKPRHFWSNLLSQTR